MSVPLTDQQKALVQLLTPFLLNQRVEEGKNLARRKNFTESEIEYAVAYLQQEIRAKGAQALLMEGLMGSLSDAGEKQRTEKNQAKGEAAKGNLFPGLLTGLTLVSGVAAALLTGKEGPWLMAGVLGGLAGMTGFYLLFRSLGKIK